jgi:hypothetical protein
MTISQSYMIIYLATAVVFGLPMLFILWTLRKDDKNQKRLK